MGSLGCGACEWTEDYSGIMAELSWQGGKEGNRKLLKELVTDPQQRLAKLQVINCDRGQVSFSLLAEWSKSDEYGATGSSAAAYDGGGGGIFCNGGGGNSKP